MTKKNKSELTEEVVEIVRKFPPVKFWEITLEGDSFDEEYKYHFPLIPVNHELLSNQILTYLENNPDLANKSSGNFSTEDLKAFLTENINQIHKQLFSFYKKNKTLLTEEENKKLNIYYQLDESVRNKLFCNSLNNALTETILIIHDYFKTFTKEIHKNEEWLDLQKKEQVFLEENAKLNLEFSKKNEKIINDIQVDINLIHKTKSSKEREILVQEKYSNSEKVKSLKEEYENKFNELKERFGNIDFATKKAELMLNLYEIYRSEFISENMDKLKEFKI
jgi:hypothetical protein